MRKIIAVAFLLGAIILYFVLFLRSSTSSEKPSTEKSPTITHQPFPSSSISHDTIFVPYWSDDSLLSGFNRYIYFGITPTTSGVDVTDAGYVGLPAFTAATQGSSTLLTIRMMNSDTTEKILQDKSLQEAVIQDSIRVAKNNGFDGVVLDLEYNGLAFPTVTKSITDFSVKFARETKETHLLFYQTFFGDTFYLARPYDVATIAQNADGIFILAYDFHKANGTPGPNFPLQVEADSDYTFAQMVADFSKKVSQDKITVVFGMFGYDWTIDSEERPTRQAESLSDSAIQVKFLKECLLKNCVVHRDNSTQEPSVTYVDNDGQNHIVWFEDMQSISQKEKILQRNGISHVGFWANGYF